MPKYKKWSDFYTKKLTVKDILGNYYSAELFEEILKRKPKTILEVGSGTGAMGIFLSLLGFDVTSIDNDKKMVESCKEANKRFNSKVKFEFGDAFKLKGKYDLVFSQGIFEHFSNEEIRRLLDQQLKTAKKHILISVPNSYYPEKDFGNERLLKNKEWVSLIKKLCKDKKVSITYFDYQFMLRKDKPFKTIFNLALNRKVCTLIIVEKLS